MKEMKTIKLRVSFSLNEFDVGMRRLHQEFQQISDSSPSTKVANQKMKVHILGILHSYCQGNNFAEVASSFQIEVPQKPKELIVDSKAKQHEEIADGTSTDSLGIEAMQARFKPTFGD